MSDEAASFASTRSRLEEIVSQVRKKDVSLEKSLDLLEEGVRLANQCTELIDHADWEAASVPGPEADEPADAVESVDEATGGESTGDEAADDEAADDEAADDEAAYDEESDTLGG